MQRTLRSVSSNDQQKRNESEVAMDGNETESLAVASLRIDWLQEIVRRCQELVGHLLPDRSHVDASAVEAFVQQLPKPCGPGEVMVMKALLLDLAVSVEETAKGRLRGSARGSEPAPVARPRVRPAWTPECGRWWASWLHATFASCFESQAAHRAAFLMTERFTESWPLSRLARETGTEPRALAAGFQSVFGTTPKKYLRDVRVNHALDRLLNGEKVEFIPADVGYRSRKDMNRAFAQLFGLPPSRVRGLPESELERLRQRLAGRRPYSQVH
jgi:AraC-like DNA-binding protein